MSPTSISSAVLAACLALAGLSPARRQDPPAPAPTEPAPARASTLAQPLYLDASPPEVRSLRVIHLVHVDVPKAPRDVTRTRAEALELARHLCTLLRAGGDFDELSREYSASKNAAQGGILGSYTPGVLVPEMDAYLFSAGVGDVSEPLETAGGTLVLQRIETYAATRHILVRGKEPEHRERALALLARIRAGEDFAAVARESSDDTFSRERGGLFTLFERGPSDHLLKAAAFRAAVGETVEPIESPVGWHLIQRVPAQGHPRDLAETTLIRVRAVLISHDNTPLGGVSAPRPMADAERLATQIRDRVRAGEDFAAIAAEHDDDLGGKERAGDLGWLHRANPRVAPVLAELFKCEPGELIGPVLTRGGYVVARRER
jgi:parvulin-like peptidyl-prolyl isomerase